MERLFVRYSQIGYFRGALNGDDGWRTNLLYPIFPLVGPRNRGNLTGGTPGYYQEG